MHCLPDKQGVFTRPCPSLTERRGAPTGGPARTSVRVGGGGNSVHQGSESCMQQHMNRLGALLCAGSTARHLESTEGEAMGTPAHLKTVKLDLLIAKFDYYVVTNPSPGDWPLSFAITREGIFLFVKPVQFALLWPWVKL